MNEMDWATGASGETRETEIDCATGVYIGEAPG